MLWVGVVVTWCSVLGAMWWTTRRVPIAVWAPPASRREQEPFGVVASVGLRARFPRSLELPLAALARCCRQDVADPGFRGAVVLGGCVAGTLLLVSPATSVVAIVLAIVSARFGGARMAKRRSDAVAREVPHVLDLLAACSTAGLGIPVALRHAAGSARGPLGTYLADAVSTTELGTRWDAAMSNVAEIANVPELHRVVGVLRRAERLGVPLADSLVPLAADARARRFALALDRARKAPIKMLFPLVFLVLPAFLLLTVVPVLVSTIGSME